MNFKIAWIKVALVNDPWLVQRLLSDHAQSLSKRSPGWDLVRSVLKSGVLVSEGDEWRMQRRVLQPLFHEAPIRSYEATMRTEIERTIEIISKAGGQPLAAGSLMADLTYRIVGACLFGKDFEKHASLMHESIGIVLDELGNRLASGGGFQFLSKILSRRKRKFDEACKLLSELVDMVSAARADDGTEPGIVRRMANAKDPVTGQTLSREVIRDQVLTLIVAGHETTANLLAWGFSALAAEPEWQDFARKGEAELDAVIEEMLRLYPPVWTFGRRAEEKIEIDQSVIARDSVVVFSPLALQRNPRWWKNATRFDPTRHLVADAEKTNPPLASFGGGSRLCMGKAFAWMEARLVIKMTLDRYRIESKSKIPDPFDQPIRALTLRIPDSHELRFMPRN